MAVKQAVGRFQMPQDVGRKPQGPRPLGGGEVFGLGLLQHPTLTQDRAKDRHRQSPRCHTFGHTRPLVARIRRLYHRGKPHKEPGMDRKDDCKDLPPAALRALAEAAERRQAAARKPPLPPELGGRDGPDPVRYGDWEKKGLAVDF